MTDLNPALDAGVNFETAIANAMTRMIPPKSSP